LFIISKIFKAPKKAPKEQHLAYILPIAPWATRLQGNRVDESRMAWTVLLA
jgi:hypothetical protein